MRPNEPASMTRAELTDVAIFGAMQRYGDMCIHAVIDLKREIAADALERAYVATLESFPVLAHRYVPGTWRDRWARVETPLAEAVSTEDAPDLEAATESWLRSGPDATRDRQLRVVALRHGGKTRIVLSVLHLAVDGAGIAAVGHVFGAHLAGVAPSAPVEPRRDVLRALDGLRWFHAAPMLRGMVSSAMRPLLQLFAAPRLEAYATDAGAAPTWRHIAISAGELATMRARCHDATVNDILIAAMARVGARRSERRSVVVTYTMDLRRYSKEARLFATNSSAILAAIVPRDAIGDLAATTARVARLTARDRARLAGPAFMLAPYAFAAGAPHALARRIIEWAAPAIVDLPLDRGLLMTNVGRVDDGLSVFGDDIEAIRIVGPNVHALPVPVVVALGFRGGLDLQLYAGPGFGESALEELESEIRDALELAAE